jgi:ferric-dicitrate binding protein FerR (iron transport regulator)
MIDQDGPDDPGSEADERRRWEMIHRFLDGLSTLPERREVQRWMNDDLSVQRYINAHKKVWTLIGRRMGPHPIDQEDAWESLQDRIAEHDRRTRFTLPGRGLEHLRVEDGGLETGVPARRRIILRAAAGVAAALVLGVTSFVAVRHSDDIRTLASIIVSGPSAPMDIAVRRGEHPRDARLPDGTRVVLAPDSRLHFALDRSGAHIATLVGEASFSVVHDPRRAFLVRAPGFETRDVGTEFDVSAYPGSAPRVAVKSGSVALSAAHDAAVLDGGRIGKIDPATGTISVSLVGESYFAWTSGRLAFVDTPLREVADELGRRYNLDIQIADANLAAVPVTITVADGTADSALRLLVATVAGLQFEQNGQKVRLFRQ